MELRMNVSRNALGYYRASCPELPGCTVWAMSRKEAKNKLCRAVLGYMTRLEVVLPRQLARLAGSAHDQHAGVPQPRGRPLRRAISAAALL
jgi:predicted RNase H-like HicB family nuclease